MNECLYESMKQYGNGFGHLLFKNLDFDLL